jgi:hypothetical protein
VAIGNRTHIGFLQRIFGPIAIGAACCCGCAPSGMVEVSGEVTIDSKPVEQGLINFWPADGGGPSAGFVLANGKYRGKVAVGEKKISIEALQQIGERRPGGPDSAPIPIHKTITPDRYRDPQTTELRCEVSQQSAVHNFELTSK